MDKEKNKMDAIEKAIGQAISDHSAKDGWTKEGYLSYHIATRKYSPKDVDITVQNMVKEGKMKKEVREGLTRDGDGYKSYTFYRLSPDFFEQLVAERSHRL